MELLLKIRRYENLHIVFWLIKDSCWMLELRWLGAIMMVPTLLLAIYITIKSRGTPDVFISGAIFCWILANSYWMMIEFFNNNQFKSLAAIPFGFGFVMVAIFYWKTYKLKKVSSNLS